MQSLNLGRGAKTGAFTLVELLVVMTIISVLAALLIPCLIKASELAKRISCAGNLSQMGIANGLYLGDWENWLPVKQYKLVGGSAADWKNQLAPYLGITSFPLSGNFKGINMGVFRCSLWTRDLAVEKGNTWYRCYEGGYGWNHELSGIEDWTHSPRRKITQLKGLSESLLIADSASDPANLTYLLTLEHPSACGPLLAVGDRHNHGPNALWADLHVQWALWATLVEGKAGHGLNPMDYYFLPKF